MDNLENMSIRLFELNQENGSIKLFPISSFQLIAWIHRDMSH